MRTGNGPSPLFPRGRGRGTRDDAAVEKPLDGRGKAASSPDIQQAVARLLEAAAGPATEEELSGEPAIVAAFVLAVNAAGLRSGKQGLLQGDRRTVGRVPALVTVIAMAAGAAIGGTATAGALPPRIQEIAHTAFGAPAPHHGGGASAPASSYSPQQVSPGPTGRHRSGDSSSRATAKAVPSTTGPEHPKPGRPPGRPRPKATPKPTAPEPPSKDSQGRKNGQQQAANEQAGRQPTSPPRSIPNGQWRLP